MHRMKGVSAAVTLVAASCLGLAGGCSSDAKTGALVGTGFGAMMGQAIGGNTTGTLIGAGVGAGAGYMIGNEGDRRAAREEQARRDAAQAQRNREQEAAIRRLEAQQAETNAANARTTPTTGVFVPPAWPGSTNQMQPFADTVWRVSSMTPPPSRQFSSMTLHFLPNGQVVTTESFPDGSINVASESYRVVGNTLIINGSDYLTNSVWIMNRNSLTLINQGFRTELERAGDGD